MAYYIDINRCTACNNCIQVCTNGAIIDLINELYVNPVWCQECGSCEAMCYDSAIQHEGLDGGAILKNNEYVEEFSWYHQEHLLAV